MEKSFKQIRFNHLKNKTEEELLGCVIIGLDIDWAPDFILKDTLQLASELGINPTLFLTHESPLIKKVFEEKKYEFGLHPNFEKLLNGDVSNGVSAADVLERLILLFPGVEVIRSHNLTTSSRLKALFHCNNFSVESSFITHGTKTKFPNLWKEWTGMVHVPITWEDDVWFTLKDGEITPYASNVLQSDSLNVLTFHPIHLYLNTTDVAHYEASREFFNNPQKLISIRNTENIGVRTIFKDIAQMINGGFHAIR